MKIKKFLEPSGEIPNIFVYSSTTHPIHQNLYRAIATRDDGTLEVRWIDPLKYKDFNVDGKNVRGYLYYIEDKNNVREDGTYPLIPSNRYTQYISQDFENYKRSHPAFIGTYSDMLHDIVLRDYNESREPAVISQGTPETEFTRQLQDIMKRTAEYKKRQELYNEGAKQLASVPAAGIMGLLEKTFPSQIIGAAFDKNNSFMDSWLGGNRGLQEIDENINPNSNLFFDLAFPGAASKTLKLGSKAASKTFELGLRAVKSPIGRWLTTFRPASYRGGWNRFGPIEFRFNPSTLRSGGFPDDVKLAKMSKAAEEAEETAEAAEEAAETVTKPTETIVESVEEPARHILNPERPKSIFERLPGLRTQYQNEDEVAQAYNLIEDAILSKKVGAEGSLVQLHPTGRGYYVTIDGKLRVMSGPFYNILKNENYIIPNLENASIKAAKEAEEVAKEVARKAAELKRLREEKILRARRELAETPTDEVFANNTEKYKKIRNRANVPTISSEEDIKAILERIKYKRKNNGIAGESSLNIPDLAASLLDDEGKLKYPLLYPQVKDNDRILSIIKDLRDGRLSPEDVLEMIKREKNISIVKGEKYDPETGLIFQDREYGDVNLPLTIQLLSDETTPLLRETEYMPVFNGSSPTLNPLTLLPELDDAAKFRLSIGNYGNFVFGTRDKFIASDYTANLRPKLFNLVVDKLKKKGVPLTKDNIEYGMNIIENILGIEALLGFKFGRQFKNATLDKFIKRLGYTDLSFPTAAQSLVLDTGVNGIKRYLENVGVSNIRWRNGKHAIDGDEILWDPLLIQEWLDNQAAYSRLFGNKLLMGGILQLLFENPKLGDTLRYDLRGRMFDDIDPNFGLLNNDQRLQREVYRRLNEKTIDGKPLNKVGTLQQFAEANDFRGINTFNGQDPYPTDVFGKHKKYILEAKGSMKKGGKLRKKLLRRR